MVTRASEVLTQSGPTIVTDNPVVFAPPPPPDAELLIKEARRRHRRRLLLIGAIVLMVAVGGVLIVRSAAHTPKAAPPSSPPSRPAHLRAVVLNAGAFAGTWHVHTFILTIGTHGHGVFTWPIHTWCGTGPGSSPPPCDAIVPGTAVIDGVTSNVQQIIDGGHATVALSSVSSSRARGVISGSTDPSQVPDGPATFTVLPNDLLSVVPKAKLGPSALGSPLCGPQAAALSLAEQEAKNINCGA